MTDSCIVNKIERTILAILVIAGAFFLITGVGGGGYRFTTGEWFVNRRSTPTETRVVGAIMIGFALLLSRLKSK